MLHNIEHAVVSCVLLWLLFDALAILDTIYFQSKTWSLQIKRISWQVINTRVKKGLSCIFFCCRIKPRKDTYARPAGNPRFAMWPNQFRWAEVRARLNYDICMRLDMNVGCYTVTDTSRKGEVKDLNAQWSARHTWIASPDDWILICREMYIRLHHVSDVVFILLICSGCSIHWYFTV